MHAIDAVDVDHGVKARERQELEAGKKVPVRAPIVSRRATAGGNPPTQPLISKLTCRRDILVDGERRPDIRRATGI